MEMYTGVAHESKLDRQTFACQKVELICQVDIWGEKKNVPFLYSLFFISGGVL
jgi:hypothetical protein